MIRPDTDLMSSGTHPVRLTLLLALSYLAMAEAGMLLAIPPDYATPVFPAAGLALTALLWFGGRAVPGIWLGAVMVNLSHVLLEKNLSPTTAAMVVAMACGATLQGWIGSRLVSWRSGDRWRNLEHERDAAALLLYGGVVAGTLSASTGVGALLAAGVIPPADILRNWVIWYVGDAIGILLFAPLVLGLLSRENSLWKERRRRLLVTLLVVLSPVALAFFGTARWERQAQSS